MRERRCLSPHHLSEDIGMDTKNRHNRLCVHHQEPKYAFLPFVTEVCMIAGITKNLKAEKPTLGEFNQAQSTDTVFRSAFLSVGKPNTGFNLDEEGVLVRVSP